MLVPLSATSSNGDISQRSVSDDVNGEKQIRSQASLASVTRRRFVLPEVAEIQRLNSVASSPRAILPIATTNSSQGQSPISMSASQYQSNPPGYIQEADGTSASTVQLNPMYSVASNMTDAQQYATSKYPGDSTEYDSDLDSMYLPAPASDEMTFSSKPSSTTRFSFSRQDSSHGNSMSQQLLNNS